MLLVVNVASKCGLTPQYEGLQTLYADKQAAAWKCWVSRPTTSWAQEPGSEAEIQQFCQLEYNVSFPMFAKISVAGDDTHPLYQRADRRPAGRHRRRPACARSCKALWPSTGLVVNAAPGVLWNFEKFLIGRDGKVIARFAPDVPADDARLVAAIDAALAA